jgi:hypothetical protein
MHFMAVAKPAQVAGALGDSSLLGGFEPWHR